MMKYKDNYEIMEGDIVSSDLGENEQIIFIISTKKEIDFFGVKESGFFLTIKYQNHTNDAVFIPFKFSQKENLKLISRSHILPENSYLLEHYNLKHNKEDI